MPPVASARRSEAARLLLADDAGRGGRPRRCARGRQPSTRRDLMKTAVERRPRRGRRRSGRRRRRACAGRGASGSSAWWRLAWPRIAADRRSSAPISATSSGRRAGATVASTSARPSSAAPTCSSAIGGHAGAAGFEIAHRALGRVPRRGSSPLPPSRPRRIRGSRSPIDLALPALRRRLRASIRELAGLAPCGPGNADPLVAVLGMVVTRVRAATGGHSQLTLRRDRDVLDGIAFGRSGHRRDRPRGRPPRRRRPPDQPDVRRVRDRSSSTSATWRRPAATPRPTAILAMTGALTEPPPMPSSPATRVVTGSASPKPRAGDPFGVGSVGSWLAPILSIVGLHRRRVRHASGLLDGSTAVRRQLERQRATTTALGPGTATATARPAPSNVVIVPPRRHVPGLDRLRQGRQHLGPDRQAGPPDHGLTRMRRQRLDAVLVARRQDDLLHPDDRRDRPLAVPGAASCALRR